MLIYLVKSFASGSDEESLKSGILVKKRKKSEKPGYKMFDADNSDEEAIVYDDSTKYVVKYAMQ